MINKEDYYPTPDEVSYFIRKTPDKTFEELLVLLGVDEDYLLDVIEDKGLKVEGFEIEDEDDFEYEGTY